MMVLEIILLIWAALMIVDTTILVVLVVYLINMCLSCLVYCYKGIKCYLVH